MTSRDNEIYAPGVDLLNNDLTTKPLDNKIYPPGVGLWQDV